MISADGSCVTWTTTVPEYDFAVRRHELRRPSCEPRDRWWDSRTRSPAPGSNATGSISRRAPRHRVSASARTVAYSAPHTAPTHVRDGHASHEGLSVSSTQGQLVTPGFMTSIDIPRIPLTSLRGYSSTHRERADLPAPDLPAAHLPAPDLPAADLPAAHRRTRRSTSCPSISCRSTSCRSTSSSFPGGWDRGAGRHALRRGAAPERRPGRGPRVGRARPSRAGRPRRMPSERRPSASRASPSATSTSTTAASTR